MASEQKPETAIFAAGCFWCAEHDFKQIDGVLDVVSGYTGGTVVNPTYQQVITQTTGHYEAVQVTYDPQKVSYHQLLEVFWDNHDPFDTQGQFCDKGYSYRGAVFANKEQYDEAEAFLNEKQKAYTMKISTPVLEAGPFYPAEEYHQNYYKKNPLKYKIYRFNCGRDQRLDELNQ